jgi:large repetitive protein
VVTNVAGARQGALAQYDPFGDPIDPTSHLIGATTSDDAVPNDTKLTGTQSFAWEGSAGEPRQHTGADMANKAITYALHEQVKEGPPT